MRTCPKCRRTLQSLEVRGVRLDSCPQCAGIWFDADELRQLQMSGPEAWLDLEARIAPRSEVPASATGRIEPVCPQCKSAMQSYRFLYDSEITLDECTDCGGVWVDDSELGAMAEYLAQAEAEVSGRPKGLLTPEEARRIAAHFHDDPERAQGLAVALSALRAISPRGSSTGPGA